MAVSVAERRYLLGQVNQMAQSEVRRLWRQAALLSDLDFAGFVIDAYPELLDPFVQMSAELAAAWFELSDPGHVARTADPIPVGRLQNSAEWALSALGGEALSRFNGVTERAVFDGARQTTLLNVQQTRTSWMRVAQADACEFCALLATRTAAYRSEDSADFESHDACNCMAVEVPPDRDWTDLVDGDYLSRVEQWESEYRKARADAGSGDPKAILSAWRKLGSPE